MQSIFVDLVKNEVKRINDTSFQTAKKECLVRGHGEVKCNIAAGVRTSIESLAPTVVATSIQSSNPKIMIGGLVFATNAKSIGRVAGNAIETFATGTKEDLVLMSSDFGGAPCGYMPERSIDIQKHSMSVHNTSHSYDIYDFENDVPDLESVKHFRQMVVYKDPQENNGQIGNHRSKIIAKTEKQLKNKCVVTMNALFDEIDTMEKNNNIIDAYETAKQCESFQFDQIEFERTCQLQEENFERNEMFNSIGNSLNSMSQSAAMCGNKDLSKILSMGNQLCSITSNVSTISASMATGTMTIACYTGIIGIVAAGISIACTIMAGDNDDDNLGLALQGIYNAMIEGFNIVIGRLGIIEDKINKLGEHIDYRFDNLHGRIDEKQLTTMINIIDIVRQGNTIQNYAKHEHIINNERFNKVQYDLNIISSSLEEGITLLNANMNAFRHENFHELIIEIRYGIINKTLQQENIHNFLAKMESKFYTVVKNHHITGKHIKDLPINEQLSIVRNTHAFDLINYYSDEILAHPAILKLMLNYTKILIDILPGKSKNQLIFFEKLKEEQVKLTNFCASIINENPELEDLNEVVNRYIANKKNQLTEISENKRRMEMNEYHRLNNEILKNEYCKYFAEETRRMQIGLGGQTNSAFQEYPICSRHPQNIPSLILTNSQLEDPFPKYEGLVNHTPVTPIGTSGALAKWQREYNQQIVNLMQTKCVKGKNICSYMHDRSNCSNRLYCTAHTECKPVPNEVSETFSIVAKCHKNICDIILSNDYDKIIDLDPLLRNLKNTKHHNWYWQELKQNIATINVNYNCPVIITYKSNNEQICVAYEIHSLYFEKMKSIGCTMNVTVTNIFESRVEMIVEIYDIANDKILKKKIIALDTIIDNEVLEKLKNIPMDNMDKLISLIHGTRCISEFGIKIIMWSELNGCMDDKIYEIKYNIPIKNKKMIDNESLFALIHAHGMNTMINDIYNEKIQIMKENCESMDTEFKNKKLINETIQTKILKKNELKARLENMFA